MVIASVMASIVSAAERLAYLVRKNSRHAAYSLCGALYPITLNQNSCSTASVLASADGHRHSFRKVVRKRSWKVRRGCPQEPATLFAKPDRATRQITML